MIYSEKKSILIFCQILFIICLGCNSSKKTDITADKIKKNHSPIDELLSFNSYLDSYKGYKYFISKGKDIIPALIDKIDTNAFTSTLCFPKSGSSVIISPGTGEGGYVGIRCAFMIKFLLLGEKDDEETIKRYSFYTYNSIVRKDNPRQILQYDDIKMLKKVFETWWKKNKDKSLEELQREYKEDNHPLADTNFTWI